MSKREMEIGEMIKEYRFWKREAERLEEIIWGVGISNRSVGVARYGIEASMPRGSSLKSSSELKQMDTRQRVQIKRWEKLNSYVTALEQGFDVLENEKLQTIYDCLLAGMTYRQIAGLLGKSKDYVRIKRNEIVDLINQSSQFREQIQKIA